MMLLDWAFNNVKPKELGVGPCDFSVTLVPIGLGLLTAFDLGLGLGTLDFGQGLDNIYDTLVKIEMSFVAQ